MVFSTTGAMRFKAASTGADNNCEEPAVSGSGVGCCEAAAVSVGGVAFAAAGAAAATKAALIAPFPSSPVLFNLFGGGAAASAAFVFFGAMLVL